MDEGITIVGPDALPAEWFARIKPELAPGERLVWAGQSKPSHRYSGRTVAMIWAAGFGTIGVLAFAGLFEILGATLSKANADGFLATVAVGSSAIAFLILVGLFAHGLGSMGQRPVMSSSLYALTDSRAIIWSPSGGSVLVVSHRRGTFKGVHRVEFADGSGSVHFTTPSVNPYGTPTGFLEVADARRVEALVRLHLIADSSTT